MLVFVTSAHCDSSLKPQAKEAKHSAKKMLRYVLRTGKEAQAKLIVKQKLVKEAKVSLADSRLYAKLLRHAIKKGKKIIEKATKTVKHARMKTVRQRKRERTSRKAMHRYIGHLDLEMAKERKLAEKASMVSVQEPLAKIAKAQAQIALDLARLKLAVVQSNAADDSKSVHKSVYDQVRIPLT